MADRKDPRRHTPEFRASFVHLDRPSRIDEDAKLTYSLLMVLDPEDEEHDAYIGDLEGWIEEVAQEKWGEVPRKLRSPIRDGEDISESGEFDGMVCVNLANTRKPGIIDADLERIDEMDQAEELYSGAWFKCSIRPYAWEHKTGGKGVSFSLDNVMKVRDDEPLGASAPPPEDDFAEAKTSGRKRARSSGRRRK
jgi:hypothetical protein